MTPKQEAYRKQAEKVMAQMKKRHFDPYYCDTKEEAYNKMKTALYNRLKMDGDEKNIDLLADGVEFSNAILNENDAYIYQNFGETYHHWKIIEV